MFMDCGRSEKGMCKYCGCGKEEEKVVYECKKCGKISEKQEMCCGELM